LLQIYDFYDQLVNTTIISRFVSIQIIIAIKLPISVYLNRFSQQKTNISDQVSQ